MRACTLVTSVDVATVPVTTWPPVTTAELSETLMIFSEALGEGVFSAPAAGVARTRGDAGLVLMIGVADASGGRGAID